MYLNAMGQALGVDSSVLGRIATAPVAPCAQHRDYVAFGTAKALEAFGADLQTYAAVLSPSAMPKAQPGFSRGVFGVRHLDYLSDGDVVVLRPSGAVGVLYRQNSPHNTILATERCNSLCLMCSQPPKETDDSYLVAEILRLIDLIDPACQALGLSGGEPTLLGHDLLRIISKCRDSLPNTSLHVLTNGRRFSEGQYAFELGVLGHPDLMLGIPLYSDIDTEHDYVVQARGAYDETVSGLYNLTRAAVLVEIRVVLHKQTVGRLPQLAEFIYRNLPFAAHVALMGMEMFGFVHRNLSDLWIDPVDYMPQLEEATTALALQGMNVSIYNLPLCLLPRSVWPFARRSISDWKNVFLEECDHCGVRDYCSGFFHSATKRHSAHIRPLPKLEPAVAEVLQASCD